MLLKANSPVVDNREINVCDYYMWHLNGNPRLPWMRVPWPPTCVTKLDKMRPQSLVGLMLYPSFWWDSFLSMSTRIVSMSFTWFFVQIPSTISQLIYARITWMCDIATDSAFILLDTLKVDTKDKERRRWEVLGWNKDRKLCISCAWFHHFSQIISRQLPLTAHTARLLFPPIRKLFFCIRAPKPLKSSCKMSSLLKQFLAEKNYKVNYKTKLSEEVLFHNFIIWTIYFKLASLSQ